MGHPHTIKMLDCGKHFNVHLAATRLTTVEDAAGTYMMLARARNFLECQEASMTWSGILERLENATARPRDVFVSRHVWGFLSPKF